MEIVFSLSILIAGILIGNFIGTREKLNLITDKERYKELNKELRQQVESKELVIYNLKREILEVKKSLLQVLKKADNTLNTSGYLKEQIDILEEDIKIELATDYQSNN